MERSRRHPSKAATVIRAALVSEETGSAFHTSFFFSCFFFILRRMGKNKALAHHTFTYFQTRRVSIYLSCFRSPTLAGAPFGSHCRYSVSCPYQWSSLQPRQRKLPLYIRMRVYVDPACPLRVSFGGDSHNQGGVLYTVIGGMRYSN